MAARMRAAALGHITEVQRYYDAGFTVPDGRHAALFDNNWGYIRRIRGAISSASARRRLGL
jgi:hypothetical protein